MRNQQVMTIDVFEKQLATHQKQLTSVLPAHVPARKFMRTAVSAAQSNPDILAADQRSVLNACQKAAQDGLIVDNREAALVLFNKKVGNDWIKVAQYMPMVTGVLKKLRNSGQLASITAETVHKNDKFQYDPGKDDVPSHIVDWFSDRGDMVGVYAVAKLSNGECVVEIMNHTQIEKVRKVSKSGAHKDTGEPIGIWKQWPEEMAKKTVLRRIAKYLPSSADLDQMFQHDNENYELDEPKDVTGTGSEEPASSGEEGSGGKKKKTKKKATKTRAAAAVDDAEDDDEDVAADDADVIDGDFSEVNEDDDGDPPFDDDDDDEDDGPI